MLAAGLSDLTGILKALQANFAKRSFHPPVAHARQGNGQFDSGITKDPHRIGFLINFVFAASR
jgi:hypothetical protein